MSDNPPLTTEHIVAKLHSIDQAITSLAASQETANIIAFAAAAVPGSKDRMRALRMARERLEIPTDRTSTHE